MSVSATTVQLILALLPAAQKIVFSIGNQLVELDTKEVSKEEVIAALEASRSENWPDLKFISSKQV